MNYKTSILFFAAMLCMNFSHAQVSPVIGYGKHQIDPDTKQKYAHYTFKITALPNGQKNVGAFDLGSGPNESQFHKETIYRDVLDTKKPPILINAPLGWSGNQANMMESNQYEIHWRVNNHPSSSLQPGQSNDQFTVRLPKADPTYVTAYYQGPEVTYPGPVRRVTSFDNIAPRLSFHLETHQHGKHHHKKHRHGWTEVHIDDVRATDNYDPHPVVLLKSVTSKDKDFKPADVDAVFNEETKSFWIKRVPNREYTVTYTAMDASGNKVDVSRNIWAH